MNHENKPETIILGHIGIGKYFALAASLVHSPVIIAAVKAQEQRIKEERQKEIDEMNAKYCKHFGKTSLSQTLFYRLNEMQAPKKRYIDQTDRIPCPKTRHKRWRK